MDIPEEAKNQIVSVAQESLSTFDNIARAAQRALDSPPGSGPDAVAAINTLINHAAEEQHICTKLGHKLRLIGRSGGRPPTGVAEDYIRSAPPGQIGGGFGPARPEISGVRYQFGNTSNERGAIPILGLHQL